MQSPAELNLARKWRPKTFDTIVGQDIPVRMLKNGLYLQKFFPVYLFAGQRGCGKTSTARVFAAALNCQKTEEFRQNPRLTIPCLECESCIAMLNGNHPDFIEIDAASHTGVDNVRQIIESSSYMPLLGAKKIYLIDEAHMLSKAAFNAFLKLLEEPPKSVLFILATTETHKIPETVLSRCFQVIFTPIANTPLKTHLRAMCDQESITIDDQALDLLIHETDGSARDAINLLERVRFSNTHITEETLLHILGKISNADLCALLEYIIDAQPHNIIATLQSPSFELINSTIIWDMLIELCRTLICIKYKATTTLPSWAQTSSILAALDAKCSLEKLYTISTTLWHHEELFHQTSKKNIFLEMLLVQLASGITPLTTKSPATAPFLQKTNAAPLPQATKIQQAQTPSIEQTSKPLAEAKQPSTLLPAWTSFLEALNQAGDALLESIFKQATLVEPFAPQTPLVIKLSAKSKFFTDKLNECKQIWQPLINKAFPENQSISFAAPTEQEPSPRPRPPQVAESAAAAPQPPRQPPVQSQQPIKPWQGKKNYQAAPKQPSPNALNLENIDVQDKEKWPIANLLISHFPGKIKKVTQ
ncbi:MAG: polymerase III, tau subunit protein [candidate division TM6 bacterium GW2011_GWF2_38_10]|nr:MAG: polymerase III, tau subunit protein [candidate division TM6 bacterium GW2011_GWF2_38_10]